MAATHGPDGGPPPASGDVFQQTFDHLVGDADRLASTRETLVEGVGSYQHGFDETSPYKRLFDATSSVLDSAITTTDADNETQNDVFNAGRGGIGITVGFLRTLDGIYVEHANGVPQEPARVTQSTSKAVRHAYGIAFSGATVSQVNVEAARLGVNPRNPLNWPRIFWNFRTNIEIDGGVPVSPGAFAVESTEGQLDVRPRFAKMKKIRDLQCPAIDARVSLDGHSQPGLSLFLRTIGEVAMTEIFPQHFEVASPGA